MYYQKTKIPTKTKKSLSAKAIVLISVIAVIVIAGGIFAYLKITSKPKEITTASSNTKGEPAGQPSDNGTTPPSSSDKGDTSGDVGPTTGTSGTKDNSTPSSNATLIDPTGNFVSNHHPNLSGSPAPNQIQSICNTTPGATCQIIFTKDGVTKQLPAQKTDSGGATYWTWKLQDIGLTAGSWHVQAKATLGTQTKTADDAMNLEVAQ